MTHAQLCPVCNGSGKITTNENKTLIIDAQCHGCFGRGWVEVSDPINIPIYQPIRDNTGGYIAIEEHYC